MIAPIEVLFLLLQNKHETITEVGGDVVGKQPHANICGAKTRSGLPCRNRPMANGRCRMHGGKSTGPPKGNKNALKTGEYETIWLDTLDTEERELYNLINTDVLKQIEEELRLITIRERRMLQRREKLR